MSGFGSFETVSTWQVTLNDPVRARESGSGMQDAVSQFIQRINLVGVGWLLVSVSTTLGVSRGFVATQEEEPKATKPS